MATTSGARVGASSTTDLPRMASQSTMVITQLVADALGLELTPEVRSGLLRRKDLGALEYRLQGIGGAIGIGYLTRVLSLDGMTEAAETTDAPLVLLDAAGADAVVLGLGRRARVVHVRADGQQIELPAAGPALIAAIVAIVGNTPRALSPLLLDPSSDPVRFAVSSLVDTRSAPGTSTARQGQGVFSRVLELLARDRRDIFILFAYAALSGVFALTLPLSVGAIVQLVQGGLILQPVVILIGYVVVGTLASGGLQLLQLGVVERIQQRVFARMALEFTFRVPRVRYETAMQEDLPETMNRLFEAVVIQKSLSKFLLDTSTALLTVIAGLVLLTFYHPYFTFFGALMLGVLWSILWISGPTGLETSLMESKYKYRAIHWLEELARSFHAFKFAGRSPLGIQRMDEVLTGYLTYRNKHFKVLMRQTLSVVLFRTLVVGTFLVLGSKLVIDRQISLGQFVASEIVIVTVLLSIEKIILSMSTIYDILTSAEKAGYVSDLPLDDLGGASLPPSALGMAVELRDVSYRYAPGAPDVLSHASLRIAPGERIAIAGYTGTGRSTLLKLLAGLPTDYDGTVLFDGVPLRALDRTVFRENIGQCLSPTDLFDGSIIENVSVGRPGITDADVVEAIDAVGLTRDVEQMPEGIHSLIVHGGRRLPHGLAIKLLMARAIAGGPRLVVVDDLFQNLQHNERLRVVALLTEAARPWTLVMVSHDPQLLAAMDRVVVVEDGAIRRDAPFDELRNDPYIQQLIEAEASARRLGEVG